MLIPNHFFKKETFTEHCFWKKKNHPFSQQKTHCQCQSTHESYLPAISLGLTRCPWHGISPFYFSIQCGMTWVFSFQGNFKVFVSCTSAPENKVLKAWGFDDRVNTCTDKMYTFVFAQGMSAQRKRKFQKRWVKASGAVLRGDRHTAC